MRMLFYSSQVDLRYLLRGGRYANRILFLRRVNGTSFVFSKAQDDVGAKDEDRGRDLPFMLRLERAPHAGLVQVVSQ